MTNTNSKKKTAVKAVSGSEAPKKVADLVKEEGLSTEADTTNCANKNTKENKTMKNLIKENRKAEFERKEAEAKEGAIQAILEKTEAVDVVKMMGKVENKEVHTFRNKDGMAVGVNGGALLQMPVVTENGVTTIAAKSQEELDALKERIDRGQQGDGMFHKTLCIDGWMCDCVGATEAELEQDILNARIFRESVKKNHGCMCDVDVAEQLVDAEFKQDELEEICVEGNRFLINYTDGCVMDFAGNTIVDLADISSKLNREDMKTILVQRLETWIAENFSEDNFDEDECDGYDDYDEDDDYDYDEEECGW